MPGCSVKTSGRGSNFRGQTLNSKSGYNRSGICRLTLEVVDENEVNENPSNPTEEPREPRGLENLTTWRQNEKRKQTSHEEQQQKPKKRRKLNFPTMPEDWGEGVGIDMDRIEEED